MTLRITYTDEAPPASRESTSPSVRQPTPHYGSGPAFADWDDGQVQALLLYLPDEPQIGHRFEYGGATWEIVDYHDGWVARLVV